MLRPPLTKFAADQSRTDRQALAVLARQPHRNSSDYLFGERAFNNWDRCKQEVDQRAGIAPYRLHDLRRTCATMLGEIGVQPHHIEAIINHYSGHRSGVAGVYQRAKYADEMRSALQRCGSSRPDNGVIGVCEGAKHDCVTRLDRDWAAGVNHAWNSRHRCRDRSPAVAMAYLQSITAVGEGVGCRV